VASLKVVVSKQLLILEVTVLSLNGVKLISKSKVILVSLLNLENLSLELGDKQVFLVTSKVHTIVVS